MSKCCMLTFLFTQHAKHENASFPALFKYIEHFTTKNWKFLDKNSDIFYIFLLKT